MSDERLKYQGRREELGLAKKAIELRIEGIVSNMRNALDPLKRPEDLRTDAIAEWAIELADAQDQLKEILDDLKKIKDILGR